MISSIPMDTLWVLNNWQNVTEFEQTIIIDQKMGKNKKKNTWQRKTYKKR